MKIRNSLIIASLFLLSMSPVSGAAEKLELHALFKDKAIIVIDGKRRVMKTGDTSPEGVKLFATDTQEETAEIEIDGKRQKIRLGMVASSFASSGKGSVIIYPERGHYFVDGSINGVAVRFLVDTGASTVTMDSSTAKRIGLDYRRIGRAGYANTAAGAVKKYMLKLNRVQVGDIVMSNVDGGVIEDMNAPFVLLGMSFLGNFEMTRDIDKLEIRER